jgi:hypothetical protein
MVCNLLSSLPWRWRRARSYECKNAFNVSGILLFLLAISSAGAHGQTGAAILRGSVQGRVTCYDGGFPARGAFVSLTPLSRFIPLVQPLSDKDGGQTPAPKTPDEARPAGAATDFDGYYFIPSVYPGIYILSVRLDGYSQDFEFLQQDSKSLSPDRQKELLAEFPEVIVQAAGNIHKDVVIRRGAAIVGRVSFDSGGIPGKATVYAKLVTENLTDDAIDGIGSRHAFSWSAQGTTDDRGFYRVAGLPHGKYRIEVQVRESGIEKGAGYLPVFAPEALTEGEAKLIAVGDGEERTDVDISIPLRLFHSIGGTVTRDGIPFAGASVSIQRKDQAQSRFFVSDADGKFRIDFLQPGKYAVETEYPPAWLEERGPYLKRTVIISLGDSDVLDVNLELGHKTPAE